MNRVLEIAAATIAGILVVALLSSCQASVPTKPPPAYGINISFPSEQGIVEVARAGFVTLPVTVISNVNQTIGIRLVLVDSLGRLPQFLQYEAPTQFLALGPKVRLDAQITFGVSIDAKPGDYNIGINGELQQPVPGRSAITQMFRLTVIAK